MKLSLMIGAVLVLALSEPLDGQAVFPDENGSTLAGVLAFDKLAIETVTSAVGPPISGQPATYGDLQPRADSKRAIHRRS